MPRVSALATWCGGREKQLPEDGAVPSQRGPRKKGSDRSIPDAAPGTLVDDTGDQSGEKLGSSFLLAGTRKAKPTKRRHIEGG